MSPPVRLHVRRVVAALIAALAVGLLSAVPAQAMSYVTGATLDHGPAAGGTQLTVYGVDVNYATIYFGDVRAVNPHVVDSIAVQVTAPPGVAGTTVQIKTEWQSSAPSSQAPTTFTYDLPAGPPKITSISPSTAKPGDLVTLHGDNLANVTSYTIGGVTQSVTLGAPAETFALHVPKLVPGVYDISLTTPYGTTENTPEDDLTVLPDGSPPAIASITPSHGPTGGGTEVTLRGDHFTGATSVSFGGADAASFQVISDGEIRATTPPLTGQASVAAVSVVTSSGGEAGGTLPSFTYDVPTLGRYDATGSATLRSLARGVLAMGGSADLSFFIDGSVSGSLALADTNATLVAGGFLPVTARFGFIPAGGATGKLSAGRLALAENFRIDVKQLKVLGLALTSGTCRSKQVSRIPLASASFDPAKGGVLAGTFSISDLAGCGALTGLVSPLTASSSNALSLALTPRG